MSYELIRIIIALVISIAIMIFLNRYLNVHAFFSLLIASVVVGLIAGKSFPEIISAMQTGFGSLLQQIGFIVAFGSCLGCIMEKTGAMHIIGHKIIYTFGAQRSVFAMSMIGVIVGIPVFCDSGFIILSKLIPSIASQASINPAQLTLALSSSLYTAHTLVPPTPGPLTAAVNFNMAERLGNVILIGIAVSLPVTFVSYFFSRKIGQRITLNTVTINEENNTGKKISFLLALLPLVLPILLIAMAMLPKALDLTGPASDIILVMGHPVIALFIGLIFSLRLIHHSHKANLPSWISEALKDAGIILLITGAGGAFGYVIKSCNIDKILQQYATETHTHGIIFIPVAFVLAALLKTAQGSTTSSMIITSSLLAPIAAIAGFDTPVELSLLVITIGGGAMVVSHANDSYFWVVSQFGGLTPKDALRSFTLITLLQGLTVLAVTMILFMLF